MAASHGAFTTGTDDGDVRRRNIQSYEKSNGSTVYKLEAEDAKKLSEVNTVQAIPLRLRFSQVLTPTQQKSGFVAFLDEWEFLIAPLIFTALAFFTRMWRIGLSPIVTWDEAQ
jgi:dolichyl-phosphate-mannose-protein mannosyltransferase